MFAIASSHNNALRACGDTCVLLPNEVYAPAWSCICHENQNAPTMAISNRMCVPQSVTIQY